MTQKNAAIARGDEPIIRFRPVEEKDLDGILEIYNWYVLHSTATFHIATVSKQTMREMLNPGDPVYRSFLILRGDEPAGYVLFTGINGREAFRRAAEATVYLRRDVAGHGIGGRALRFIEGEAAGAGIKTLIAKVTGENAASLALFAKNGYAECGRLHAVAEKFGRVLDLVILEKHI